VKLREGKLYKDENLNMGVFISSLLNYSSVYRESWGVTACSTHHYDNLPSKT